MRNKRTKTAVSFFRCGYKITGSSYSKLYKVIKSSRLNAADMNEKSGKLYLTVPFYNSRCLRNICKANGYEIEKTSYGDAIRAVKRMIRRPALILGLFAVILVIMYLKNTVMRFDIINENETIRNDIMNVLKEEGVTVGSYIPDIELVNVERALKQRVSGISWAGITRKGNSLIIDVIENIPAEKGSYSRFPTNLVAKENAIIDKITLLDGQLMTVTGSGVRKGDIIISGIVEKKKSSWKDGKETVETNMRYTRSMGVVEGTFERTVVFEQKLDDIVKKETGNVFKQHYLNLFSADIPLFLKAKTGNYFTQESSSSAQIAGRKLPFGLKTLTLREYDYKPIKYSQQQAEELLKKKTEKYEINFLKEYKIKDKSVSVTSDDRSVKMNVTYKLYGNICEEAAFFIEK